MSALPYNHARLQELAQEIIANVRELALAGWTPATSSNFSERLDDRPTFVLDPMLATGGSLEFTCRLLAERGAPQPINVVCVLAAPEGLDRIAQSGIDVVITTAAIDSHLNELAYIVPGLGDAGDRQFGLW